MKATSNFDIHVPFVEHLGLQLLEKDDGRVVIRLDPRPEHMNSWNGIHGGVLMTLLDAALSSAARSLDPACIGATTVEMKANFLSAASGPVLAEGHARRAGRSLIFAEGEVRDPAGPVLAKASGTFKLVYPKGTEQ
ncbi:MAG TPA: PaaI family thioesterase [Burkholderiales bacterium]|nr:PaaI family thioesterase [Burkholderiales bacterium]